MSLLSELCDELESCLEASEQLVEAHAAKVLSKAVIIPRHIAQQFRRELFERMGRIDDGRQIIDDIEELPTRKTRARAKRRQTP